MKSFPVLESIGEVFSGVTRHYVELIAAAPVAVLAYVAAVVASAFVMAPLMQPDLTQEAQTQVWMSILKTQWHILVPLFIVYVLAAFSSAVRWHRFVLVGERGGALWGPFQTRYLWTGFKLLLVALVWLIGFSLIAGLVAGTIGAVLGAQGGSPKIVTVIAFALVTVIMVFWYMILARLMLAFPDAALAGDGRIRSAWERTKGNGWRLLGYVILIQLALMLIFGIASRLVALILKIIFAAAIPSLTGQEQLAASLICIPISIYALMIGVTMLSVAYREIVGLPVASGETEVP